MQESTYKKGFSVDWSAICSREASLFLSIPDTISNHSPSCLSLCPTGFLVCIWTRGTNIFLRSMAVAIPSARHMLLLRSYYTILFPSWGTCWIITCLPALFEHSAQDNISYQDFFFNTWICFLHSICHHLIYLFAYHFHCHWMVGYLFLSTLCLLPMCSRNVVGTWNMFLKYMQEFLPTIAACMIFLRICWEWGKISYAEMKWVGHNLKKNLSIAN